MGDSYWNYQNALKRPRSDYELPPSGLPSSHEMHNYLAQDGSHDVSQSTKDTNVIQSAYDRYLQNALPSQTVSLAPGTTGAYDGTLLGRTVATGSPGQFINNSPGVGHGVAVHRDHIPIDDQGARFGAVGHDHHQALMAHSWGVGQGHLPLADQAATARSGTLGQYHLPISDQAAMADYGSGGQDRFYAADPLMARSGPLGLNQVSNSQNYYSRPAVEKIQSPARHTAPLPRDASSTLFVEGLPSDCRPREAAHLFRPFVGYREVRLVPKEFKHRNRETLILCFVDFASPACAATAMNALQGYKMDEHDPDSGYLRLQFSRDPGPRSGSRRKR